MDRKAFSQAGSWYSLSPKIQEVYDIREFETLCLSFPGSLGRDEYLIWCDLVYSGRILNDEEYPLRMNWYKKVVDKLAALVVGQWQKTPSSSILSIDVQPIQSHRRPDGSEYAVWKKSAEDIVQFLNDTLFVHNAGNVIVTQVVEDMGRFGLGLFQLGYDSKTKVINLAAVCPANVHFRWDRFGRLYDAVAVSEVPIAEANMIVEQEDISAEGRKQWLEFGQTKKGLIQYTEYWSADTYRVWLHDIKIKDGTNGLRFVPFILAPNCQTSESVYGLSDLDGLVELGKDLNTGYADSGDAVNADSHPIRGVVDCENATKLENSGEALWNVRTSRDRMSNTQAKPFQLPATGAGRYVTEHVKELRQAFEDLSDVPAVSYGRQQGTQASGYSLQIQLLPATNMADKKRVYLGSAIRTLLRMIAVTGMRQGLLALEREEESLIRDFVITPGFAPMLPRDRVSQVNEIVAEISADVLSRKRAMKELGIEDPDQTWKEIMEEKKKLAKASVIPGQNPAQKAGVKPMADPDAGSAVETDKEGFNTGTGTRPGSSGG